MLRGRVTDSTGAPLAGALVEIAETFWRRTTDPDGSFVLSVPRGTWPISVRMLGYSPESLTVAVPSASVSIRLRAAPVELRAIALTASQAPPLSSTVTSETVRQVPPLGEPDIFRSVVLLPGVSQPNDLKGRIHLAGGASDETGVRLDGHPLQEPFHLLGVLGAFNIAALDRADVLIHHVPVDKSAGLSGIIDLWSRRVPPKSENEVLVGLLSAGLTTVRPRLPGGFDLLGSVRTTYLDNFIEQLGGQVRVGGDELTLLGYRDGLLRIGKTLSERTRAEGLVFSTEDNRRTAGVSSSAAPPYIWGEVLWGVRIEHLGSNWLVRARSSFSRASANKKSGRSTQFVPDPEYLALRRDWVSTSLDATRVLERSSLRLGAGLDVRRTKQRWLSSSPALVPPRAPRRFSGGEDQILPNLFVETAHRIKAGVGLTAGIRASYLDGQTFVAPSVVMAQDLGRSSRLELALERRHQFVAELEEPEAGSGNQPLFLLQTPRVANVAAFSLSPRSGSGARNWTAVAFVKRYHDRTRLVGSPRRHMDSTGQLPEIFPDFARVPGRSYGLALSGTRAVGAATLIQASYTFQRATEQVGDVHSPVEWDAPHALNVFGSLRLRQKWFVNGVFQAKSGQVSNYQRFDAAVRRQWRARGADWAMSLHVMNLLNRRNALPPDREPPYCTPTGECDPVKRARSGLPIVPSLTLEVRW